MGFDLSLIDWIIIGAYLSLALIIGFAMSRKAGTDKESYFVAGRSLPWWWTGSSVAATTFASDTPLAITGIIAVYGLSGNWMWMCWLAVHTGIIVFFAVSWRKSKALTDAELVTMRYDEPWASRVRLFRAGLYGILINCITLGWVLKAMVKIATPFFPWDKWFPGLIGAIAVIWPQSSAMGTPAEGLTVILLLALVGIYSSMGGVRGVILTDLIQLGIALSKRYKIMTMFTMGTNNMKRYIPD